MLFFLQANVPARASQAGAGAGALGLSGIGGASPKKITDEDETNIASYKHKWFTKPLGFQVSEAIAIKNGVIDSMDTKGGEVGKKLDGGKVEMSMGEGQTTPFSSGKDASRLAVGGDRSTSDALVKTYVVVSAVRRSLPLQVGDRLVAINGQAVSSWSFWELTDKLKHLPLPLTLDFIRMSEHVLQV